MAQVIQLYKKSKKSVVDSLRNLADQIEAVENDDEYQFFIAVIHKKPEADEYSYIHYNFSPPELVYALEVCKAYSICDYTDRRG